MLGFSEVTYTYATITCSRPGCNNRLDLQPGPEDLDRELRDLRSLRHAAAELGWSFRNDDQVTYCPRHNRKETA